MKKILFLSIFTTLFGQIQYSGYLNTEAKIRNHSGEILDLPYRLSEFNFSYTFAIIDIISKMDVEFRNETMEGLFSLREFYVGFYPSFGEIRFGKQINSWGLADGNNPTDNLNPYDLNYMFLAGTDRKIGSLSLTFDTYIDDHKLGIVLIPNHEPNRFPIKDADFNINDIDPPLTIENEGEFQWGLSLQSMLGESDIMLTYFNGYDFSPSYAGKNSLCQYQFEYRKTQVFGISTISFWNDLTFRTEIAYIDTRTAIDLDESANYKAQYIQYVIQLEYPVPSDMTLTAQLIGNKILSISGDNFDDKKEPTPEPITANSENFKMGLGTPFASFSENALLLSFQKKYLDSQFDVSIFAMIDLTQMGYMFGVNLEYSPIENWGITVGNSKFIGDGKKGTQYIFNKLEEFSNASLSVKYSF
jgi:hypothetical protein